MNAIIVTHAFRQKIENRKAVKTGVGLSVTGTEGPYIAVREDMTYGVLWLKMVNGLLQRFVDDTQLNGEEIRFISGFTDLTKMGNKVMRTLVKCIEKRVTTEEEVDKVHYTLNNWERRKNHQLYVELVCNALILSSRGINVSFHPHQLKTPQCGALYAQIEKLIPA
jgi:hypothetical protein